MADSDDEQPETSTSVQEPYEASSSVSISFRLEWKIPKETFIMRDHVPRPPPEEIPSVFPDFMIIENSHLFEFENLKLHPFYLSLVSDIRVREDSDSFFLHLTTNAPNEGPPLLDYAMACLDGRLFSLKDSKDFTPDFMRGRGLRLGPIHRSKEDHITIVCGIKASSAVSISPPNETDTGGYKLVCSLPVEVPSTSLRAWSTSASSTGGEALAKYSITGELPTLNVELATDVLERSSRGKEFIELRALCVEYLMSNLTAENVIDVFRTACTSHANDLVSECREFITKYCRVTDTRKSTQARV